ncbi:MAG: tetratricopeptide repeat protein [Armatimonadetes bacterium]|nr:tetratricopeptide repeat protein [Armatimonadota bacterium]MDW8120924.1 tetratricopeptide repeat protein [Armatimonadota bacterium]
MRKTRKEKERAKKRWAEKAELTRFGLGKIAESLSRQALDWYEKGSNFQRSGKVAEAEDAFYKALEVYPDAVDALKALGTLLLQSGRVQEALALLQRAAELAPTDGAVLVFLGEAYLQTGRPSRAVETLDKALSSHLSEELRHRAAEQRKRALALKSSAPLSEEEVKELEENLHWAQFYLDMGFPRRAREFWQKARQLAPEDQRVTSLQEQLERQTESL